MGFVQYQTRPGINIEATPLLNEGGWSFGTGVRFFQGFLQKKGGFLHMNPTPLVGTARGMVAWGDQAGNPYMAIGTEQRLTLFEGGALSDITPIRQTTNPAVNFSTVATQPTVTIFDINHGANATDWVNIVVPIAIGGLIVQGFYQIASIIDANTYTITAASNAISTVNNAGVVPTYQAFAGNASVTVVEPNHGLIPTNNFTVHVGLTVGTLVLSGMYQVASVIDANTITIQPGGLSGINGGPTPENSGNAQIQYLLPTGPSSAALTTSTGYGLGVFDGGGLYGNSGTSIIPLRQWFLDHFGSFLIGNYTQSPIYLWRPGTDANAIPINTTNFPGALQPPVNVNVSFMSGQQEMLIALGCDTPGGGAFNPLLVRWCDAGDFTDWQAMSTNQAGSFPIASGSKLVGGVSAPNFNCLWTDVDLWLMNYLGGTGLASLVWGFNRITGSRGLLSAKSAIVVGNEVFFPSPDGFYRFNGGRVTPIPCSVWDAFWQNINLLQVDKVNAQPNSQFSEITWAYPSLLGNGECDSNITLNIIDNSWTLETGPTWIRTSWIDQNVYGNPIGVDLNRVIQQAESTFDADGVAIQASAQTGWVAVSEGDWVMMMERLEADLLITGGNQTVYVTVYAKDYSQPTAKYPVRVYGPYAWVLGAGPPYSIVRARGRFMSMKIASIDTGVFWRLGRMRYKTQKAGRRP